MKILLVLSVVVFALMASFAFIGWSSQSESAARPTLISVDSRTNFQTITGWEATAQVGALASKAFPYYKKQLFDRAVNELGITRVRVEIRSSTENSVDYFRLNPGGEERHNPVNDNANPFVINPRGFQFSELDFKIENIVLELKKRLEAKGAKLFVNVCFVDFVSSPFEHREHPEEYAEFVEATYLHLRSKYGFVPDAWEIALEADNGGWSPRQMADAMIATAKRLKGRGFTPRFIAPSTANMSAALSYFDEMIQIPGVLPAWWEFSYHRYSGVSQKTLRQIGNRSVTYRIHTAMLEHIASNYQSLHDDLELGRNSCWQQYTLAYPGTTDTGGKYYLIDDNNPQAPRVILSSRAKFLRQYFKFIRPGAIRIKATSSSGNLRPLAFINRNGKYVVVVEANQAGSFSIRGLPAGAYGIKYTTADRYNVDLPNRGIQSGQQLKANIPNAGVITIYGRIPRPGLTKKSSE